MRHFIAIVLFSMFTFTTSVYAHAPEEVCETELIGETTKQELEAGAAFQKFFADIETQLFERDFFLEVSKLALLAREHVLMLGPPGNAKSMGVDLIIDNIVDETSGETSTFKIQMTPETSLSETHGVIDYKKITEENIQTRKWEQGLLSARLVFIDEFFDARANAIRNNLMALNEREHAQGRERIKGVTETGFAASNKYIHEVYEKAGDDGPKAIIDRFAFVAFVPGELSDVNSALKLIVEDGHKATGRLTFQELGRLQKKLKEVEVPEHVARMLTLVFMRMKGQSEALEESEKKRYADQKKAGLNPLPPYRATKYYSARTLRKAGKVLRAIVVNDWIEQKGERPLIATSQDLEKLMAFFTLNSLSDEFLTSQEELAVNPYEKIQVMSVLKERSMFREIYQAMMTEVNSKAAVLTEIEIEREAALTPEAQKALVEKMVAALMRTTVAHVPSTQIRDLSEADIVNDYVRVTLESWLREAIGADYEKVVAVKIEEVRREQERRATEARRIERERIAREKAEARERELRERKAAAEREARAKKFREAKEKLENPALYKVVAELPQSYSGTSLYHVTPAGEGKYEVLYVTGDVAQLGVLDAKSGRPMESRQVGTVIAENPVRISRLSNGNYLFWYGNYGRILDLKKGMSARKLMYDRHGYQSVSSTGADGEFWFYDWENRLIGRVDENTGVMSDETIPYDQIRIVSADARVTQNTFLNDMTAFGQVFVVGKGIGYLMAGEPNEKPRIYKVDLNRREAEVLNFAHKLAHDRFKSHGRTMHKANHATQDFSHVAFADQAHDNKRVYELRRGNAADPSSFVSREVQLPQEIYGRLGHWDISPDLTYMLINFNHAPIMVNIDTSEQITLNLGGFEHAGLQGLHILDSDHILVEAGNLARIIRLPTAD